MLSEKQLLNTPPSKKLYDSVRAGFIVKGYTFRKFCNENNILTPAARQALIGTWDGPKGRACRECIIKGVIAL